MGGKAPSGSMLTTVLPRQRTVDPRFSLAGEKPSRGEARAGAAAANALVRDPRPHRMRDPQLRAGQRLSEIKPAASHRERRGDGST